jgi:glycosyltransferase involved in cell wall biosynthesis
MRLLLATGIYPPSIGGPATYTKLLYEELPKHGIEAEVLSFDSVRHFPKLIRNVIYFYRAWKAAKTVDAVYAQDPVSVGLPALVAAKLRSKPFYLKVVGDYAWEQGVQRFGVEDSLDEFAARKRGYRLPVRILKAVQLQVASRARRVIVPSRYLKSILSKWGVPAERIAVVYNAFEAPEMPSESSEAIRKKEFIEGKLIVSVGRLVPWKGFDTLIRLTARMQREFPDVGLLIIGDGPDRARLERIVKEERLERAVRFAGKLPQQEMLRRLKAADVFVLNTSYEGFSHQLLEVMALGIPIITTSVGGNPELITDGVNGILVPYDDKEGLRDALSRLFSGEQKALPLVEAARKRVTEFSVERMISGLLQEIHA